MQWTIFTNVERCGEPFERGYYLACSSPAAINFLAMVS